MKPSDPRTPGDLDPDEADVFARLSRASGPSCPDPARIQAALSEVLPEEAARDVQAHLETCAACRALAADLEAWEGPDLSEHEQQRIWRRVHGEASLGRPRPRRLGSSRRWAWPAAAAALFAAVWPAYVLIRSGPPPTLPTDRPATVPTAAPALPLERLAVLTPPAGALVWRDGGDAFERDLRDALAPYEAGDLPEAARRLEALAPKYPQAPAPSLYLGVSRLLQDRAAEAVPPLEAARGGAGSFWLPHAQWYLAVASERAGDRARAVSLLKEICAGDSVYAPRACAASRALGDSTR